jgi:ABC-type sulfate transport system substrate-binding protein
MSGLAAVLTAAADYSDETALSAAQTSLIEFRNWFEPVLESVPNFNSLGASPAETLAARGASVGDIALLPESEWLVNLRGTLVGGDAVRLSYPEYNFLFDFPLARWIDAEAAPETGSAVAQFAGWLTSAAQQTAAQGYGLRPAAGTPTGERFTAAERYGALPAPDLTHVITPPPRNAMQSLLSWVGTVVQ